MTNNLIRRRRGSRRLALLAALPPALALVAVAPGAPVDAAAVPATATATAPSAGPAVPADVVPLQTRVSLLGEHRWYRQVVNGVPVVGGLYAEHLTTSGSKAGTVKTWDGRVPTGPLASSSPSYAPVSSVSIAEEATGGEQAEGVEPSLWVVPGPVSRLAYRVTTVVTGATNGDGVATSDVTYVDAQSGKVISTEVESKSDDGAPDSADVTGTLVTGSARVFDPNPPAKLQRQNLTDQNDANAAVPTNAYTTKPLTNLNNSHTLVGKWAKIDNANLVGSSTNTYNFMRNAEGFEQVMAYYALNSEEEYYQSLGFTDVNAEQQDILTNTISDDNSFYSPSADQITMGRGGVDDAEDPEVTWHEAGHATQDDQVPGFGASEEAGSIGEAFGDYMAVTMADVGGAPDTAKTPSWCVMDWDSVSYTSGPIHCLRTTHENKTYPGDLTGEVHADGEIWSQALYEMNLAIGRDDAARAIVEAQFTFTPSITMPVAARKTVTTARQLYGTATAAKVRKCFADRGIL